MDFQREITLINFYSSISESSLVRTKRDLERKIESGLDHTGDYADHLNCIKHVLILMYNH